MSVQLISYINLICASVSCWVLLWLILKSVPMRRPLLYFILCFGIQSSAWMVSNWFMPRMSAAFDIATFLAQLYLTGWYAPKEHRRYAISSMLLYYAVMLLSELVALFVFMPVFHSIGIPMEVLSDPGDPHFAVMSILCTCVYIPLIYSASFLLKKVLKPNRISLWYLLLLPIPLSQTVLIIMSLRLITVSEQPGSAYIFVGAGTMLCIAADLCFLLCTSRIRKADIMQEQLKAVQNQLNTQVSYYHQMQENILSINRIRHDLNNQLQAAYYLMEQGKHDQVRQQLNLLQESIISRVGPRYSGNLMVDAVLSEKAKVCREKGIQLNISAVIPATLPIENVHLCSVFSNLLDNAIHGAAACASADREIEICSSIHGNYLAVQCRNTAADDTDSHKKTNDLLRKHGLGLEIMDYLAKQYDGSLETHYDDGIFCASILLRLPE